MLIKKHREVNTEAQEEDEINILCIQIAGLCHDLGKYFMAIEWLL